MMIWVRPLVIGEGEGLRGSYLTPAARSPEHGSPVLPSRCYARGGRGREGVGDASP